MVHVGCEKETYQKIQNARTLEATQVEEMSEVSDKINSIRQRTKKMEKVPDGLELTLKTLESKAVTLKKELEQNRKEIKKMNDLLEAGRNSEIVVNGYVYRGTVVCLFSPAQSCGNTFSVHMAFLKFRQRKSPVPTAWTPAPNGQYPHR